MISYILSYVQNTLDCFLRDNADDNEVKQNIDKHLSHNSPRTLSTNLITLLPSATVDPPSNNTHEFKYNRPEPLGSGQQRKKK